MLKTTNRLEKQIKLIFDENTNQSNNRNTCFQKISKLNQILNTSIIFVDVFRIF